MRIAVDGRAEAVEAALESVEELSEGERVRQVRQLAGGWSRHSYVVTVSGTGETRRSYVVRVRPRGALLDTDLALEFQLYRALEDVDIPTPRAWALVDEDDTPFGGPFLVMEYIEGRVPNMYGRGDQESLAADWTGPRAIAEDMAATLARLHAVAADRLPADLPALGFGDVLERWRGVYDERRLIRDPVLEEAFDWVAGRVPAEPWPGLVHGDYRIGNTLIDGGRVRAVLDWELAYLGDVRFDLGYLAIPRASGKHLQARSPLMGGFADRGWFMERYGELTGRTVDDETLATFQMLGIMMLLATQITAVRMYADGRTADMRMAWSAFSFAGLRQDMTELMGW
jgi:aminoglycoside phosphotransferase (APT) family kinase protein